MKAYADADTCTHVCFLLLFVTLSLVAHLFSLGCVPARESVYAWTQIHLNMLSAYGIAYA